jgi:hypothetical protein
MTTSISAAKQPKPNTKPPSAAKPMTKPALVVFGTDSLGKPHASWFPAGEHEAAVKAAGVMNFSTLMVATDDQVELARKLPRGRIFEGGRAFVPFVKHVLHEKITALAADQSKADQASAAGAQPRESDTSAPTASPLQQEQPQAITQAPAEAPPVQASATPAPTSAGPSISPPPTGSSPQRRPKHWDEITVGDLVLAYDPEIEGWFEAIVLGIDGELLRLRWRDYPLERLAPQRRDQLALLPPAA